MLDGTFAASGGTSTGNPLLLDADRSGVDVDLAGSSTDTVHAQTGGADLTGDIAAGATLWISGVPGYTQGLLNVAGAYTNRGTLELGAGVGTDQTQGNVAVASGSLTNAGTLISNNNGTGGPNSVSGTFVNTGAMNLLGSVGGNGQIANTGTITLAAGANISATSFGQAAPGTLSASIAAGSSTLQNPIVNLTGAASLGGGLTITTSGSQTANVALVRAASVTGTFPSPVFAGQSYYVVYAPTSVTLSTTPPSTTTTTTSTTTTTTTTPTTTTRPPSTPVRPAATAVSGGAGSVSVKLSCPASAASCAAATVRATVSESVKAARGKKAKSKVVTVGSAKAILTPGKSRTVTVKLNHTGTALLTGHARLKVTVTVTVGGKVVKRTTTEVHAAGKKRGKRKP